MTQAERIRRQVAEDYARAALRPVEENQGCCSTSSSPKGTAARVAGYENDELAALPDDAVTNSFGCGNPLAFGEVSEGQVVLDLGCGAGIDILLAARKVGPRGQAIGVDMTDEMVRRARLNIEASRLENLEVRQGLIEDLPVEDGSVDWVISNCVINLSPEKDRVFSEVHRVLKPGGRFRISDIVAEDLPEELRKTSAIYSCCIGGAISESAYLDGLREAGLEDLQVLDRVVYTEGQISTFLKSAESDDGCGCGCLTADRAEVLAESVAGKIWSEQIYARK